MIDKNITFDYERIIHERDLLSSDKNRNTLMIEIIQHCICMKY